ncbi:MAG: transglutaminase domain-containing protein, partial [Oscillospiraceae bacterium]
MKKLTSLLLSIVLLLSMVSSSASAFAKSQEGPQYKSEIINLKSLDPDTVSDKSNSSDIVYANSFLSSNPSEPYRFYSFLDKNQQNIYDTVHNSIMAGNFKEEYTVNFPNQIKFDATIENNNLVIAEETKEFLNQLFLGAMSALIDDYPMMFWISRVGYSFSHIDGKMGSDGIYHAVVDNATISIPLDKTVFSDYNKVKSKYNALQNAVNTFTVNGTTRYEKVKSIHDSIAKLAAYDNNFSPESYSPTSAILSPYLTVCEGYAESFKLICDREGIPCIIVVGDAVIGANAEDHAWNYVKMEDNKWYGLDLTWDDQEGEIFYDFFLVGANTVAPSFEGKKTFSQYHTPIGDRFPGSFRLTYPMLADNAYEVPKIELV